MTARMIVELPDGAKIHFGQEPATGLAEAERWPTYRQSYWAQFKAALGALSGLVAALEELGWPHGQTAGQDRDGIRRLAERLVAICGSCPVKARRISR